MIQVVTILPIQYYLSFNLSMIFLKKIVDFDKNF